MASHWGVKPYRNPHNTIAADHLALGFPKHIATLNSTALLRDNRVGLGHFWPSFGVGPLAR
ncbi:MAG: hypothetical protein FVQ83_12370 [Chloroflexi bacterium]|nr:hypothetical protein [Chloroflexota bacterium]